jgi:hypothetical protein
VSYAGISQIYAGVTDMSVVLGVSADQPAALLFYMCENNHISKVLMVTEFHDIGLVNKDTKFYIHVTVHRDKFPYNKTK